MTAPVILTSGDQTPHRLLTTDLNQTFPLNTAAPNWQTIPYVEDNDFTGDDPVFAESGIFGDGGAGNQDKLGYSWHASLTLNHMVVPGTAAYHAVHNFLEAHAVNSLGPQNRVQLRFYDYDVNDPSGLFTPRGQAYMGFASYSWPFYGGGGTNDKRQIVVPFMGKGPIVPIAHPYPVAASVPIVNSVSPATLATAGGDPFDIFGSGFTGTTGVTVGGVAATKVTVVSPNRIIAISPAHAAGVVAVVVTNATGPSTTGTTAATYA